MASHSSGQVRPPFFWGFASTNIPQIIQFITTAILARILLPEDFGLMGMALAIISFIDIFKDGGLGEALIQHRGNHGRAANLAFWIQSGCAVFFVLVLWLIAPLAAGYMGSGQLSGILRALSLVFFASPFVAIPLSVMIRHLEFKRIAVIQSLSMLISALISISMAWAGYGVWSLVAGHLAGSYLTAAFFLFEWRPGFDLGLESARRILSFGSNMVLVRILFWTNSSLLLLFIGKYQGAAVLGYLSMAISLSLKPMSYIAVPFEKIMYPLFSRIARENGKLKNYYLGALRKLSVITIPSCCAVFILSPSFVNVVIGPKWCAITPMVRILVLSVFIGNFAILNSAVFKALGSPGILTRLTLARTIFSVPILFWASRHGVMIMLWSYLLFSVIFDSISAWLCGRILNISPGEFVQALGPALNMFLGMALFGILSALLVPAHLSNSLSGFLIQVVAVCVIFMAVLKKFEPDIFCKLVLTARKRIAVMGR